MLAIEGSQRTCVGWWKEASWKGRLVVKQTLSKIVRMQIGFSLSEERSRREEAEPLRARLAARFIWHDRRRVGGLEG
jgi:hypothetical protein